VGLARYVFKRALRAFTVLTISISLIYISARAIPGDPITVLYGENIPDPLLRLQLENALGLNSPLHVQLLTYFSKLLRGDMGRSLYHGVYVFDVIVNRLYASLLLALASTALTTISSFIATYLELTLKRGSRTLSILSSLSASLPTLGWGSILLALSIYVGFKIPLGTIYGPLLVLSFVGFGFSYRYLRASMLRALEGGFILTYRALGFSPARVFMKAFRTSFPELLTVTLYRFGLILSSAVVVESLFQYPGMGSLFVLALQSRDYPLLIGWSVVAASVAVAVNLLTDVAHAILDPRVKLYE